MTRTLAASKASTLTSKLSGEHGAGPKPVSAGIFLGVIVCFILSGFAALLYQTAWMRQFSLVFGTSELAIAAVLSAYMGGLALGANLAARYIHKVTRPVLFYGVLEAAIAGAALCVPIFLMIARMVYIAVFGGQDSPVDASGLGQSFFYLIVAFLVLVIPTALMGATLPLLIKYVVQRKDQIGSRVGLLYAMNTAGAIGGTLVAGFILLPSLGLNGTIWVGVAINVLVFFLAALVARAIGDHGKLHEDHAALEAQLAKDNEAEASEEASTQPSVQISTAELSEETSLSSEAKTQPASKPLKITPADIPAKGPSWSLLSGQFWILPIMLLSGANSFVYEVLWTRLLGHILGGSITAFSTMLAGFLSGIAIGSAIASRFAKTRNQAILVFVIVQIGIALTSILIYQLLPSAIPTTQGLKGNAPLAFLVLLPATIFIGATFPLAVRVLAKDETDAASSSARVYSWNTVGAIVGATVAAFFLIPILKYEGAVKLAILVNLVLALCAAFYLPKFKAGAMGAVAAIALAVGFVYQPKMPEQVLRSSPVWTMNFGTVEFYEVGRSATVVTIEDDGYIYIRTNGLPEASIYRKGSPPAQHNQAMLSTMPVIARPDVEDMLIVGLGGGNAVEGVPSSVKTVDVIEIEKKVVDANRQYGDARRNDPLSDPRVNIIVNDARSALSLTDKRYDAIVSQPSHPWTAGASHLYTKEFMELAHEHLDDDGVYLQWMNTQFVDDFLFRSLCATMLEVFEYVRVYQWQSEVIFFIGSDSPLHVEQELARTGRPLLDAPFEYAEKGVGSVEDVLAALVMDHDNVVRFARGGDVITDNNNYMATRSARAMDDGTVVRGSDVFKLIEDYDPLLQPQSTIRRDAALSINYPYLKRRLDNLYMAPRALAISESLVDDGNAMGLAMIGMGQEAQGDREESQKNLFLALNAFPDNEQIRYAILSPWIGAIVNETTLPEPIAEQLKLLKGSAAATLVAGNAMVKDDLNRVVEVDAILARARPSDLWYNTAVKLRAQWRTLVTTPSAQPALYNEATTIVDGLLAFNREGETLLLRLKSTLGADDYVKAFETGRSLTYFVSSNLDSVDRGDFNPSQKTLGQYADQIEAVDEMLDVVEGHPSISEEYRQSLRDFVERVGSRLEYL